MFAVIRLRSCIGARRDVRDTLQMLGLKKLNWCVLLPETPDFKGMLEKVKDYVSWGEIDKPTLVELLTYRLRKAGDERIKENELKALTNCDSFEGLADALLSGKRLKDFPKLKRVFRLRPPKKGLKSKEHWPKGDLGYRGKAINELLKRMI